jgi:Predicted membrane protein
MDELKEMDLEIKWEGKPSGIFDRFLTLLHLNFTDYQITKDELIIKRGFFKRKTNTTELYLLKDPDLTESLIQRWLKIGTITVIVDSHSSSDRARTSITLKNVKDALQVRKLLRDLIEADVLERKITYFDKV